GGSMELSVGGQEAMRSADGRYWMVFNGEIYNYIELGQELRDQGVELRSTGDSEVLLETYARVGKEVVHRLRGMYAFAIWDTWTRELFCARDPFGIKPFYYCVDRGPGKVMGSQDNGARSGRGNTPRYAGTAASAGTGAGAGAVADRPRGGRHAAPAAAGGASEQEGDSASADWFAPAQPPRRPGRHAAGEAHGNGVLHPEGSSQALSPAPSPARATGPDPAAAGMPGVADLRLRFASERKALASPGQLRELDAAALRRYLAFQYVPAPDTITPPIRVLPPGHAMIVRPGGQPDVYRYWRADLRPAKAPSDDTPSTILAAMRDSVAVHLRSDAPLGAFLSGGIDSAAICALAAEHR